MERFIPLAQKGIELLANKSYMVIPNDE